MKILTNYDFSQNQLLNARIQNLAAAPATPVEGQIYYDTATKHLCYYNGTAWRVADSSEAITASHSHTNLALLETYNQTNANITDAVSKKHSANTDTGTSSTTFQVGTSGPKIKNNSGNFQLRNSGDTANVNLEILGLTLGGTLTASGNNIVIGDGTDTVAVNTTKITIKSAGTKADADAATRNVFEVIDSTATPNKLFEIRQNGDTVIGGTLTVSGTGTSTFAGDVSIAGKLTVNDTATATADLSGTDLTLSGNLVVNGNTTLGDNAGTDTTTINGVTTIKSSVTKATGTNTADVFKVVDSAGVGLFQVKQNGDAVIGGILTVSGTGTSTFAGDVSIGGKLTVADTATATADLSGTDLTLTGNLIVDGNTTLGDNAATDTVTIKGVTTVTSGVAKATGSATTNVFSVLDKDGLGLLEVKQNGDTVIGGVLTVNGEGASTFAGDVSIGGALTVTDGIVGGTTMQLGQDLTVDGKLIVKGNTTLGDAGTDTLTVQGVVTLPDTTTIGTVAYSDLTNAKSKAHSQNTDTGTSSATFQIGTSGVKIKNSSGTELQIRDAADSAYASIRVKDLYVEGTTTTINSNTVSIGDNEIELNSDVTAMAQNSDGGIVIKRLDASSTRKDAKLTFNNSTGRWDTAFGPVTAAVVTRQIANKFVATIGNGTLTAIPVVHNFGTQDVVVSIREAASPYAMVMADVEMTDTNTVTVKFAIAPATGAYIVTVVG